MNKILYLLGIILLFTNSLFSVIIAPPFEMKEFNENLYTIFLYKSMEQIEVKEKKSQNYHYAFKNKNDLYEVRYILFS